MQPQDYVRWFDSIRLGDVAVVGGKNASLGELYVGLSARGVRVPTASRLPLRPTVTRSRRPGRGKSFTGCSII
jgi:hypothetical protein